MQIYLAARYSRREELLAYRDQLEDMGHTVTSRWLNGTHQYSNDAHLIELAQGFATEDIEDLLAADICISFTEPPREISNSRGGRHVEFGYALAQGMDCYVVGYRENVFHYLAAVKFFETWEDCVAVIRVDDAAHGV